MSYRDCAVKQAELLETVVTGAAPSTLLLVEHDPVITLGAAFHKENLLLSADRYSSIGIALERSERGGDVTYHGPGQLIAYPIFDLRATGPDLHRWLRLLEEAILRVLSDFGIEGCRFPPHTGVWIGDRKVCAIGIKVRRWVSMHGLALNCDVDLGPFASIVPCGIAGYGVTSISQALGRQVTVEEVKPHLIAEFVELFR
jgi:lipoate-protein ligase B